ncbi:hypothetical protein NHX12_025193 [Muraenolepis orangiensis]|uniref:Uncharacterized protein n=1 Tax=Muraenolepis orangiensis TaxID=630683 RepID=A0A9Q0IS10_9TELE|nr:hypothetical protein NHX12_025193 [Muraenolepis orangiensis]
MGSREEVTWGPERRSHEVQRGGHMGSREEVTWGPERRSHEVQRGGHMGSREEVTWGPERRSHEVQRGGHMGSREEVTWGPERRENEVLKVQLKKYVGAVQMLKREGSQANEALLWLANRVTDRLTEWAGWLSSPEGVAVVTPALSGW